MVPCVLIRSWAVQIRLSLTTGTLSSPDLNRETGYVLRFDDEKEVRDENSGAARESAEKEERIFRPWTGPCVNEE